MALPAKKKRGLRLIEVNKIKYYWKVKNIPGASLLQIVIGLESKQTKYFTIDVQILDGHLYFPWISAAREAGRDVEINALESVTPGFIVSAIQFADASDWTIRKLFRLNYNKGGFVLKQTE